MKKDLTLEELERRRAEIDARPAETPTAEDLAAFEEADAEDPPDDRYAATGTVRDRQ